MVIKNLIPVLAIVLLAIFLRIYNLNTIPAALFGDEVDVGYQAYSISQTGRDLYGKFLPIYIRSLAEYRAPLYIYSTIPFIQIFGLNEWGVRLPAVFWGVLSIIGLYLLVKNIFSTKVAIISSFVLAISPWHLQYSRASFEVTMLLTFIIFAIYFFLLGLKNGYYLVISAFLFSLSIYIYSTAMVFIPFLLLLLIFLFSKQLLNHKKVGVLSIITMLLVLLPALWFIYQGEARERFSLVSIFQDSVLLDKINITRKGQTYFTPDGLTNVINPSQELFFHNKPTIFAQVFTLNYLRAFSPNFLFTEGDPNFRHSIHEMGVLYTFEIITIIFGLWYLLTKNEIKKKILIVGWLLISPIPAALTFDGGFHATRLFLMLPPLTIISSFGVFHLSILWQKKYLKLPIIFIISIAVLNVIFYFHRYFIHYPIESWRWWQTGFKETMTYIGQNQSKYQTVILNNSYEPALERYLFYTKYDPNKLHSEFSGEKIQSGILPGVRGYQLNNKIYFGVLEDEAKKDGGFEKIMKPGMLYLASARDDVGGRFSSPTYQHFNVLKTIVNPYGDPIFYILEGK